MGNFLSDCNNPGTLGGDNGDLKIVVRVDHALVHDTSGANVSGFKIGDQLVICNMRKGFKQLDPLSQRYNAAVRPMWPNSYRFQVAREAFFVEVISREGKSTRCVLQVPTDSSQRTMQNAMTHIEDAERATAHAAGFNKQIRSTMGNMMDNYQNQAEEAPTLKVCAPVATEVLASSAPEVLPRGSACTLTPYPHSEVTKFVFDGVNDDFLEVPQAFFHFAAFASGGREFVCDIQGAEDEFGGFHLIDPVVLREETQDVASFLNSTFREVKQDASQRLGPDHAPTEERFDRLHPRCGQLCQSFDPMRRGAKGKKGFCGITCMT